MSFQLIRWYLYKHHEVCRMSCGGESTTTSAGLVHGALIRRFWFEFRFLARFHPHLGIRVKVGTCFRCSKRTDIPYSIPYPIFHILYSISYLANSIASHSILFHIIPPKSISSFHFISRMIRCLKSFGFISKLHFFIFYPMTIDVSLHLSMQA